MIRVLLADDHAMVREAVGSALEASGRVTVVGAAGDGIEALRLARALRPAVCVVDLNLPGRDGLEVTRALAAEPAPIPALVVTSFDDEAHQRAALEAGAQGFLGKTAPVDRLLAAVEALAKGESFHQPGFDPEGAGARRHIAAETATRDNPLTPREREVLRLIAAGLSTPEIAAQLGSRPGTVKNQTASILSKLGVTDRTRAALVGLRNRWI